MSDAHRPELKDAQLSRALDVINRLLRTLDPIEALPRVAQRKAAQEARALLAEHGR